MNKPKLTQAWFRENERRRQNPTPADLTFAEGPSYAGRRNIPSKPMVFLPGLRTLVQQPNLPRIPGRVGFNHELLPYPQVGDEQILSNAENPGVPLPAPQPSLIHLPWIDHDDSRANYANKKARQWARWAQDVIPALVQPYMDYLARGRATTPHRPCTCNKPPKTLSVRAIFIDRKFTVVDIPGTN